MGRYILMRLLGFFAVLLAVSALTFFLMHSVPGGPFDAKLGDKPIPQTTKDQLNHLYGLDKPIWQQYLIFLQNAVHLDFGYSYIYTNRKVLEIYMMQWPYTIQLALMTLVVGGTVGLFLGIMAAIYQNTWIDFSGTFIAMFCIVVPTFVLAVLMQFVFCVKLGWFPTGGWDSPIQWVLPVLTNSIVPIAVLQRFVRSSMVDVMNSNFVRTARAKGVREQGVMITHVLRNALSPVVTVGGPMIAGLITGSFFIESMFRIPGVGAYSVTAIQQRDYTMIMATTMIWTTIISLTYLLTDISYALIDPRVTFVKGK
jgi:ABC-type dipeptide/oligopeptide/nickel transport system permease component